ncbi:c-type cytochrome biogenesis protein CcmI [Candidatus Enterovibrio escicola]|uniref:Cytochrome c heme lyase subunit CcmH n=1 Tax=Candidatus Enterovibrio escicola TaxID=1927127 RepID=A0A2A5T1J3_9GAMM|nr:c-type cytochrome biogenesis protein CcmI [Candidatus Enterovibrio escacola]PCS22024.1 Cytochrome c heme lyase subunit CcmH [Candidatus Enterovibrio escacola]
MTEVLFWMITALMVLSSITLLIFPIFLEKDKNESARRDELNKAFFRDRMEELQEETQKGRVENQSELVTELQQSLLDDIPSQKHTESKVRFLPIMLLPGVIFLVLLSYFLYAIFGNIHNVVLWYHTADKLPELSQRLMLETDIQMNKHEMDALILALRTKLQQTPNDAIGWLLLGRIGMKNRDIKTAEGAMIKAYKLAPDNVDIKFSYAQLLIFMGGENNAAIARKLLLDVTNKDHANM